MDTSLSECVVKAPTTPNCWVWRRLLSHHATDGGRLDMAELIPNSAILGTSGACQDEITSTAPSEITGRMAELLMNSAIARLD